MNLPLIFSTVVWVILVWGSLLPILSMPVARIKRDFVFALLIVGTMCVAIEWATRLEMHLVTLISLVSFIIFAGVIGYLLRRLDYYIEELLQELFVLAMTSAGISIVSSIWYWGIDSLMGLHLLRVIVAILPLIIFGISWYFARQNFSKWSAGIYVVLLIIKWVTLPMWGIWSIILLMLYSTLVGYVVNWMATTTYAEKVLAWNIEPSKVWSLLVLSAGMLVLFF